MHSIRQEVSSWYQNKFDFTTYTIFLLIQQNPLMTIKSISEEIGCSITLVNSRIKQLKQNGFLRPDGDVLVPFLGKRIQTEVEAVYNPYSIGLLRIHVFILGIPNMYHLNQLETLFGLHPYCHYHCASFQNDATLFVQFDVPKTGTKYLEELLVNLKNEGYFANYHSYQEYSHIKSDFDFSRWQLGSNQWDLFKEHQYETTSFETELDMMWNVYQTTKIDENKNKSDIKKPEFSFKFDEIDYKLLRELTVNAKLNISNLSQHYDIDRSRLSRRINRLRNLVIKEHKIYFNQSYFNLSQSHIFVGKYDNSEFTEKIFSNFIQNEYIPFSTSLISQKKSFLLFVQSPSWFATQLMRFLWQHTKSYSIYPLDLTTSQQYYFNHTNYIDRGKWLVSKEHLVNNPLEMLESLRSNK